MAIASYDMRTSVDVSVIVSGASGLDEGHDPVA